MQALTHSKPEVENSTARRTLYPSAASPRRGSADQPADERPSSAVRCHARARERLSTHLGQQGHQGRTRALSGQRVWLVARARVIHVGATMTRCAAGWDVSQIPLVPTAIRELPTISVLFLSPLSKPSTVSAALSLLSEQRAFAAINGPGQTATSTRTVEAGKYEKKDAVAVVLVRANRICRVEGALESTDAVARMRATVRRLAGRPACL